MGTSIDGKIAQANGRLKAARIGLTIERNGSRLLLRGTLPPKPTSARSDAHQQRLSTGQPANADGLKIAEALAKEISAALAQNKFTWDNYTKQTAKRSTPQTCAEWIRQFEQDYFHRRERNHKSETTWRVNYRVVFSRLPPDKPLTVAQMDHLIKATEPDTRFRQIACAAIGALAKFAGLNYDPSPLAGHYSPASLQPRDLPTDETIAKIFYDLTNPNWQWVYGMMATYGLRNHEVFRIDLERLRSGDRVLAILPDSKTGAREVWPFYPEWFEQFDLENIRLPNINLTRSNRAVGESVTAAFAAYNVPFSPYDLRHCWAVRTLLFELDYGMAALQMGHSIAIHKRTYHRWITREHHESAFDRMMQRGDRPQPPKLHD